MFLHIEGGSVCGSLAVCDLKKPAHIVFSCDETFSTDDAGSATSTSAALPVLDALSAAVKKVLLGIERDGLAHLTFTPLGSRKIMRVHCTVASPWFLSQTKTVSQSFAQEKVYVEAEVKAMVEQEVQVLIEHFKTSEYGERFNETLEVLESDVISLSLNGYENAQPKGKKAKEMSFSLYISLVASDLVSRISDTVDEAFHSGASVHFHTFPLVLFSVIRDIPSIPQHLLLVDVDGEVTDLTIVKKGVPIQTITVPKGVNAFVSALAAEAKLTPENALSFLSMHGEETLSEETRKKVGPVIARLKKEWQSAVAGSLDLLTEECFIPGTVLVAAEDRMQSLFSALLTDHSLGHGSTDGTPFSILTFDREFMKTHFDLSVPADHSVNSLVTALFVNRLIGR